MQIAATNNRRLSLRVRNLLWVGVGMHFFGRHVWKCFTASNERRGRIEDEAYRIAAEVGKPLVLVSKVCDFTLSIHPH